VHDSPITTSVWHNLKADKRRKGSLVMFENDRNQEEELGQLIPNVVNEPKVWIWQGGMNDT